MSLHVNPRHLLRFDDNWRFHLGCAPGAEAPGYNDAGWRALDLPHDWSIEDLAAASGPTPVVVDAVAGQWRFHRGDDLTWKDDETDEADWEQVTLPAAWELHSNYTEDNVYGWFRRKIVVEAEHRGRRIFLGLGKIDDVDETFFNGVKIGQCGSFPPEYASAYDQIRHYEIPQELIRWGAENVVAVRVYDALGKGGIYEGLPAQRHLSGPFDSYAVGTRDTGYLVGGTGWYRKTFTLEEELRDKIVHIQFDGVYMNADIWINGVHLGQHPHGYTSFMFDVTPYLNRDGENVFAVRVRNEGSNARFYSGSGIYRHVWLTAMEPVHVAHWGTCVTTSSVIPSNASVRIRTTIENDSGVDHRVTLRTVVLGPDGAEAAEVGTERDIAAGKSIELDQVLTVANPRLWGIETPDLYRALSEVATDGATVDRVSTTFGIRTIYFDSAAGFRLNGEVVKLKGACMHHDNGCLGSCAYDRAEERRVEIMKENGYNAIRTAHNPPSPAFLDACDRLGVVVIDEAFDMWVDKKRDSDYHCYFKEWWRRDLDSMLLRDRNHPSVIVWSVGNEITEQDKPYGVEVSRALVAHVHAVDPTRPVTAALNYANQWEILQENFATLDVCGYNYQPDKYDSDHARFPDRVIIATETLPSKAFEYWRGALEHPYVIGDFVWTGFDYLGESSIGWLGSGPQSVPWAVAFCGDIDICGCKRPQSYYRDALWNVGSPVSLLVMSPTPSFPGTPSSGLWEWEDVQANWTWDGHEGKTLRVNAYSSCDRVQLFLNGRDLGFRYISVATQLKGLWEVPYEPGVLKAVGYRGGNEVAQCELRTAGAPRQIRLTADRASLAADRQDLCFVAVELLDDAGVFNPNADHLIRFGIEGAARIAGVCNGNPMSLESFQQPARKAWRGRCLVVIQAMKTAGSVRLTAAAEGVASAVVDINVLEPNDCP